MSLDSSIIIVATRNQGKVREFAHAFAPLGKEVKSMFDYPELPDVVEDGVTFAENAWKKAKTVGDALGLPVLADDSGLCVDLLDGDPGVYSARYAGEGATDEQNNAKLLDALETLKSGKIQSNRCLVRHALSVRWCCMIQQPEISLRRKALRKAGLWLKQQVLVALDMIHFSMCLSTR